MATWAQALAWSVALAMSSSSSSVDRVTLELAGLRLTVETTSHSAGTGGAAGSGSAAGAEKPTPAPKAEATPPKASATGRPYYVVWSAGADRAAVVGIHQGSWAQVSEHVLRGQPLFGSNIKDCKRFGELAEAIAYYKRRRGSEDEPSVFRY